MDLDYFLTDAQKKLVETACSIGEQHMKPVRQRYDEEEIFPWDVVKVLGESGLCGAYIPKEYGGAGMGVFELVLIVEELSKVPTLSCSGETTIRRPGFCLRSQAARNLPPLP
jgi:alkylation response protein AidB-like acyl-CoA dehydrogenase